jgi:tetratricopeptide (TPR) repeat protein
MQSEPYQHFMEACRSANTSAQTEIIEARLAVAAGAERAFWLRIRANQRTRSITLPQMLQLAWSDLEEALRTAPNDTENLMAATVHALSLCVRSERMERFGEIWASIRRQRRLVANMPLFWQSVAMFHLRRRRWHQARSHFTRAIHILQENSPYPPDPTTCRLTNAYLHRSVAALACSQPDQATADLVTAQRLAERLTAAQVSHLGLALAEGELHYSRGSLQLARAALQKGLMKNASLKSRPDPWRLVETELFAARLARAEGNMVSFEHFCNRGLDICTEHNLPLSTAAVKAVLAGAER